MRMTRALLPKLEAYGGGHIVNVGSIAGRVTMVMGGKNMTMTEVQHAWRVGDCASPRRDAAREF